MLLKYLKCGKKNAIKRERLSALSGMDDRAMRDVVKLLRDNGKLICNDGDGVGYYLADNPQEAARVISDYMHRRTAIDHTIDMLIKSASSRWGESLILKILSSKGVNKWRENE